LITTQHLTTAHATANPYKPSPHFLFASHPFNKLLVLRLSCSYKVLFPVFVVPTVYSIYNWRSCSKPL